MSGGYNHRYSDQKMSIALDDPVWGTLSTAYGTNCDDICDWLRTAKNKGITHQLLNDIVNDTNHQGDTSTAMYAVAISLIELAADMPPSEERGSCLISAGMLHAASTKPGAVACPGSLAELFRESAAKGRELLLSSYIPNLGFTSHLYYLAALSAFVGFCDFGRLLEGFDVEDGGYWHMWIDGILREPGNCE